MTELYPVVPSAFPVGAPPGWRADPATPGTERFWDGAHWTEHTRPLGTLDPHVAARAALPANSRHGSRGLGLAVQILLALCSLGAIGLVLLTIQSYNALSVWRFHATAASEADVNSMGTWALYSGYAASGLRVLTGVVFLIWLGVRYTDSRVNPALLRRSASGAIISWFIPILQWWWPVQSVKDLWHASRPEAARLGRGARLPFPAVFLTWWPAWLISGSTPIPLFLVADPRFDGRYLDIVAIAQGISMIATVVAAWSLIVIITQIEDHLVAPEDSTTEPTAF